MNTRTTWYILVFVLFSTHQISAQSLFTNEDNLPRSDKGIVLILNGMAGQQRPTVVIPGTGYKQKVLIIGRQSLFTTFQSFIRHSYYDVQTYQTYSASINFYQYDIIYYAGDNLNEIKAISAATKQDGKGQWLIGQELEALKNGFPTVFWKGKPDMLFINKDNFDPEIVVPDDIQKTYNQLIVDFGI